MQRYDVNQYQVQTLLTWIENKEIAIPEIQRPFVWNAAKVRDFIDSLYRGYPVGFLIVWHNPNVRLKDGTLFRGQRILIDGQQRMAALLAALLGQKIVDKRYQQRRITIAYHPSEERFEVASAAIRRDPGWLSDIADVFGPNMTTLRFLDDYCTRNEGVDRYEIHNRMERLLNIRYNPIGVINLNAELDIETVTEVFIRINSQGTPLNAADFAMAKLAANHKNNGAELRKSIDYFCHLAIAPEAYSDLSADQEFAATRYFRAMEWLKNEKDDLYDPEYTDMLRVTSILKFRRGRLNDLVALLSGRDFATRSFDQAVIEETFKELKDGIFQFMNETNFKRFVMILRSAGFVDSSLIRAQNPVNFAYVLFLTLRMQGEQGARIESLVRRWFVMSILTARYRGSAETAFDLDIRNIHEQGVDAYLDSIEQAAMSDAFWQAGLPQQMDTSGRDNPYFNVFLASQAHHNHKGFLSHFLTVRDLLEGHRNIHHVFPRDFLRQHGFPRRRYDQIANFVIMQSEINIAVGNLPPSTYFSEMQTQCRTGVPRFGGITDACQLRENLADHGIPADMDMTAVGIDDYDSFLQKRRQLMAIRIRDYYRAL